MSAARAIHTARNWRRKPFLTSQSVSKLHQIRQPQRHCHDHTPNCKARSHWQNIQKIGIKVN